MGKLQKNILVVLILSNMLFLRLSEMCRPSRHKTSFQRRIDVETTPCVYGKELFPDATLDEGLEIPMHEIVIQLYSSTPNRKSRNYAQIQKIHSNRNHRFSEDFRGRIVTWFASIRFIKYLIGDLKWFNNQPKNKKKKLYGIHCVFQLSIFFQQALYFFVNCTLYKLYFV